MKKDFKYYAKDLLDIALPIIMGNLGYILIGVGDVLVAGRHSTDTLAAVSIATAILNCVIIIGVGLISSITPILSNIRGEGGAASRYFYPTLRFAMVISVIIMVLIWACIPLIDILGFEEHLIKPIKDFMWITSFSTFVIFLHSSLKEFLQAHEIVFVPNLITVLCVIFNVLLCFMFVFGYGPIPSMGVVGIAIASFIVRGIMGFALLIYSYKIMVFENYKDKEYYKSLIKIGLPIAMAILIEFVAFNSIAIIMARISGVYAAAQNLACTLTSIFFMIPLAISNAIAVKVGFANGAHNIPDLKKYAFVGIAMSVGVMTCSAMLFTFFPEFLVKLFTTDAELVKICIPIMYVLAMFQVFDGLQISFSGIFKGLKKTNVVLITNLIAYWFISLPLGYILAFHFNLQLMGFWYGFLIAAIILCIMLTLFLRRYLKKLHSC